jgi:ADP-heptose:LPS heptosyltransferase
MPQRYLLTHKHAPGDTVVLTALFRDIKRAYPDIELAANVNGKDLLQNNPHLTTFSSMDGVKTLNMGYRDGLRRQNVETCHFIAEFHRNFHQQTGLRVPVTEPRGDLHLSEFERTTPVVEGPYWVFLSGGKSDFTAKVWSHENWTVLVEKLRGHGIPMVQMGATHAGHWHPRVAGALDLVGRTNLRDSLRLIHHAEGVICGNTFAMHAAAALEKPCVVIAGGREAWWWAAYAAENRGLVCPERLRVSHRFLHTIGLLDCCSAHGCWRSKTTAIHGDKSVCKRPLIKPGQPVPLCLDMITPTMVEDAVLSYYVDGTLPPLESFRDAQTLSSV